MIRTPTALLLCALLGACATPPPAANRPSPVAAYQLSNRLTWGATVATLDQAEQLGLSPYLARQLRPGPATLPPAVQQQIDAMAISQTTAVCDTVAASPSSTACFRVPRTATINAAIIVFECPGSRPCRAPSRIALGINSQALPCCRSEAKSVIT